MMRRREFFKLLAFGASGFGSKISSAHSEQRRSFPRFLLSEHGCSRATGYAEANKLVTVGGKTHVAWLDSVEEGFRVRIRTLDRAKGSWSPTYTIGRAHDNHGGPALTVDSKGYLHAVYYPHHHPFRYKRSLRPNDSSFWQEEYVRIGQRCTYPTLLCGGDDTLYLTCRESTTGPWVVNFYTKPPGKGWQGPTAILRGASPRGYAHFQEALAWGPDHRTIHLSCRIYDGKPGRGHTVGYLRSRNFGRTWENSAGEPVELPATPETVTNISKLRDRTKANLRCGSLAVDHRGRPHVVYSSCAGRRPEAWLAWPDDSGCWQQRSLLGAIRKNWSAWGLTMPGGISFSRDGRMFIVLTMVQPGLTDEKKIWGNPGCEVVRLESSDGGKQFKAVMVSGLDPQVPHWLPNLERPTGFNLIDRPGIIYTAGARGDKNTQIVSNKVYWLG
ncbi:MAG: BNR-4 repeat-containing protein [Planctomycetota bacterium]